MAGVTVKVLAGGGEIVLSKCYQNAIKMLSKCYQNAIKNAIKHSHSIDGRSNSESLGRRGETLANSC